MSENIDLYDMTDEEQEAAWIAFQNRDKSLDEVSNEEQLDTDEENDEQETDIQTDENETETSDQDSSDESEQSNEPEGSDEEASEEDKTTSEKTPELFKVKAHGTMYDLTKDEVTKLASKGMDYIKKMQAIAPYRKTISAMEENDLTYEDINLLIDIKKGNKEALVTLIQKQGIDPYDLPAQEDVKYTPTQYGKDEAMLQLQEIVSRIQSDSEYSQTQKVVSSLDVKSKEEITKNPQILEGLHYDIQQGIYDKIFPFANKLAALDEYSKPFLEYYVKAGQAIYAQENEKIKQQEAMKQEKQQKVQQQKKVAGLPSQGKKVTNMIDAEISEEEFNEWYRTHVENKS